MKLMTPGPTPLPPQVVDAMGRQVLHHRTKEYGEAFDKLCKGLKYVFAADYPVITFTASGTGGMEAAVVNCFSPGDRVLLISTGVFGDRFADICLSMGLDVDKMDVAWGKVVQPEEVKSRLRNGVKGVILTHNETSTGVKNDIAAVGEALKGMDILYVVDAVSSLGGMEVRPEEWNIDVVVTSSQKALMCPPGLTFLCVSPRAVEAAKRNKGSFRHYWDFRKALDFMDRELPETPFTPAVNLVMASSQAIGLIMKEGIERVWERHSRMAEMTREGVKAMGLHLFAEEGSASETLTAIQVPEGIKAGDIRKHMEQRHGIIIAGGNKSLKGKIIRIAHMGYIFEEDVLDALNALEDALISYGYGLEKGRAWETARQVWDRRREKI
ncbi:MAG: alanine--glyoxylate aminotransferase family protein [Bacillota bacterium]|nr:alanine--glyoxylate aminotransferase family protein [Bacillota bacterium]